jgi:hypothetical protein
MKTLQIAEAKNSFSSIICDIQQEEEVSILSVDRAMQLYEKKGLKVIF